MGNGKVRKNGTATNNAVCEPSIIKLKFKADYDTLVGDETKAKNFLLECSKEYKPLKCVDVKKGSIIVTMELPQESSDGKKLEQKTMQEVVKQIKAKGFLPSSKTFAIAKENVLGVISAVCNNAKGVKDYVKDTACEVESCTPRFELVNEACVLSSVNITATTKKSVSDLEALLNVIRELLGDAILIGIGVGAVVIIALLIVCCVCVCGKKVKEKEIDEHDDENPEDAKEVAGDDPDAEAPVEEVAGEVAGDDPDADATEAPVEAAPEEEESSDDDAAAFVTETLEESTPLPKVSNASHVSE